MTENLNLENIGTQFTDIALGTIGFSGSGAIMALAPVKQQKIARIGTLAGSILFATVSQGNSKQIKASTKVLAGVALRQVHDLVKDFFTGKYQITATSPTSDKLIAGAIGLGCPDGGCQFVNEEKYNVDYLPSLNMPEPVYDTVFEEETTEEDNSFA